MAMRWYVVHVYSGFEKKVAQGIREKAAQKGLAEMFEEILVPTEEVVEVRRGAKVNAERKFFPGYVLVKMELSDETWSLVKNTPKVTGFLGGGGKPQPISQSEAERIIYQVQEGIERPKPSITFEVSVSVGVANRTLVSLTDTEISAASSSSSLRSSATVLRGTMTPGMSAAPPGRGASMRASRWPSVATQRRLGPSAPSATCI